MDKLAFVLLKRAILEYNNPNISSEEIKRSKWRVKYWEQQIESKSADN